VTDRTRTFSQPFDRLEVGAEIATPGRTITEADLVSFSALTGDWHPQHSDATWAARSQFGERIAHGMMVLSYAVGLLPIDPERVVALRGLRQVVFKRPVPIGETIRVRAEIAGTKPLDDAHGLVTLAVQVRNADGKLIARASIEALWRRGEASSDGAPEAGASESTAEVDGDPPSTPQDGGSSAGGSPVDGGRVLI
jgi:3-hydroxybutyryl-CoA dehydratase